MLVFGSMGGVGIILFSDSWKDIISNGISFSIAVFVNGWILLKAELRNYHVGWMSILGGIFVSIAFLGLTVEFEYLIFGTQKLNPIYGIIISCIFALPGVFLLYLGHRRHLLLNKDNREQQF